jgi:NitT/TauT family transport system substrate-binding protein
VITRRQLLQKAPEVVKQFVAATREGWRAYLDQPEPTNALLGKLNASIDAPTLSAAAAAQKPLIETDETKLRGLGTMNSARWQTLSEQLLDLKIVDKPALAADLFVDL